MKKQEKKSIKTSLSKKDLGELWVAKTEREKTVGSKKVQTESLTPMMKKRNKQNC